MNSMSDVWSECRFWRYGNADRMHVCASAPAFVFPLYINFISLFVYMYLYVWAVGADDVQHFSLRPFFFSFSTGFSFLFGLLSVIRFERWTNDGLCALEMFVEWQAMYTYTGPASVRESMDMVHMCVCV